MANKVRLTGDGPHHAVRSGGITDGGKNLTRFADTRIYTVYSKCTAFLYANCHFTFVKTILNKYALPGLQACQDSLVVAGASVRAIQENSDVGRDIRLRRCFGRGRTTRRSKSDQSRSK